jgi:hypothetical protein
MYIRNMSAQILTTRPRILLNKTKEVDVRSNLLSSINSQISTPCLLFEAFGMEKCFFSFDVSYPILLFFFTVSNSDMDHINIDASIFAL